MVINAEKIKNMLNYIDNVESMEGIENFDSEELVKKLYLDIFEVNIITGFE